MAYITQTNNLVGSLSGIGTYNTVGQAVFSIGWDYVFVALNSNQLTGTLVKVDSITGEPLSIVETSHDITVGLPTTNSWNSGTCIHSTTVDGIQYMYIRWDAWNNTIVYRGTWNETTKQFENFTSFATINANIAGANYNSMARMNDTAIRIITDAEWIYEFDVRTGETITPATSVGGTWSPSSYTFANTFVPLDSPTTILGASGNGANWYYQTGTSSASSFNPEATNIYADGFNTIGRAQNIHPSTHHNVSYYTPNTGIIYAYTNTGVYIQEKNPKMLINQATDITHNKAILNGSYSSLENLSVGFEFMTINADAPIIEESKASTSTGKSGTIQSWVVPETGDYNIECCGASGGTATTLNVAGGFGAKITGTFSLVKGEILTIMVGQMGGGGYGNGGGGGGGTYVYKSTTPIIVAGGGGGGSQYTGTTKIGLNASLTTSGTGTGGGINGAGGAGNSTGGSGGGGITGNGTVGYSPGTGGLSYINGGTGGNAYSGTSEGGYGGGGGSGFSAGGGGGGYSGGGGGTNASASASGGGGSYNTGTNQVNTILDTTGHGSVLIETAVVFGEANTISLGELPEGDFSAKASGLTPLTDYAYRSFAILDSQYYYSEFGYFTTTELILNFKYKINGEIKSISEGFYKENGVWKPLTSVLTKVSGEWK